MTRAYVYKRSGKPSNVLHLDEAYKVPSLGNDEVRVRVKAVSLNPIDWKMMNYLPSFLAKLPAVAGCDYSGTILESRSPSFKPGDEVYGIVHSSIKVKHGLGSLAEEIIAPAAACAHRPQGKLSVTQAAGMSLTGLTAVALAKEIDNAAPRRVLVCGGASSVGLHLVAILHKRGHYVAATCSGAKDGLVRERGADATFDYKKGNLAESLIEHTKQHGQFDAVLDCADAFDVWLACNTILSPGGGYANVGMDLTNGIAPVIRRLVSYYMRPAWLGGVARKYKRPGDIAAKGTMDVLAGLVKDGTLLPLIDSEYPFADTVKAYERLMSNRATGKVVIQVQR